MILQSTPLRSTLIGILFALRSLAAHAEDTLTIRYLGPHPSPGRSSEWINLSIKRHSPPPIVKQPVKQDVDHFFEQVSTVLTANGIIKDWQLAIPDAPAIEITIEINGKKIMLISCHTLMEQSGNYLVTEQGGRAVPDKERAAVLEKESESFRRHRIVFEKILSLAVERIRARLIGKA